MQYYVYYIRYINAKDLLKGKSQRETRLYRSSSGSRLNENNDVGQVNLCIRKVCSREDHCENKVILFNIIMKGSLIFSHETGKIPVNNISLTSGA